MRGREETEAAAAHALVRLCLRAAACRLRLCDASLVRLGLYAELSRGLG